MAVSIYEVSVFVFIKHLKGLASCLKRTQALYSEKKYDEVTLLSYRFFPDMFNFARQVQFAATHAVTCTALLAGQQVPKFDDDEKSLADLIARVEKTLAFLNTISAVELEGSEDKSVTLKGPKGDVNLKGLELLRNRSLPNFYFHTTTAYDIMRHNGVEIGKRDFMGNS